MKIKISDLSKEVIELIKEQGNISFPNLKEGVLLNTKDGVISYGIDALNLRQITSSQELDKLESLMYKETTTYDNSFDTQMVKILRNNRSFPAALTGVDTSELISNINVSKVKKVGKYLQVKDMDGVITIFNSENGKRIGEIRAAEKLKDTFHITINSDDILDFKMFDEGILLSTRYHGIYYVNLKTGKVEMIIHENSITHIEQLPNSRLLLISLRGDMYIYETRDFLKVETLYMLKNYGQTVKSVISDSKKLYILGKNLFSSDSGNVLHILSYDQNGIEYENMTDVIYPSPNSADYMVDNLSVTFDSLIVSGSFKSSPFFWIYDKNNTSKKPKEIIKDKINLSYIKGSTATDTEVFYFYDDRLLSLKHDGHIIRNYQLSNNIEDIIIAGETLYLIKDSGVDLIELKGNSYYQEITVPLENYNDSNNLEIFLSSTKGTEDVRFYSDDKEVEPYAYVRDLNQRSFIRLIGDNSKIKEMKIYTKDENIIKGIVVGVNQLFLK